MAKTSVNIETHALRPSTLIELYCIDTTDLGYNLIPAASQKMYFHNYAEDAAYSSIYFDGQKYTPMPIAFTNAEIKGEVSTLARPKLTIANIDGVISSYLQQTRNMIGTSVSRLRTFAKYLDGNTWGSGATNPFGTPDTEAIASVETYCIERVANENRDTVTFELSSILEIKNVKIPNRHMYWNFCPFKYRHDPACAFAEGAVATLQDKRFVDTKDDAGNLLTPLTDYASISEWNSATVYTYSSTVKLTLKGNVHIFVCKSVSASGTVDKPGFSNKWLKDECSRKMEGCALRFDLSHRQNFTIRTPEQALPFGGFLGLSRDEFKR